MKHHPPIQPKIKVGSPNDRYEQEADAMADQVVQRVDSDQQIQRKCEDCEEESLQMKPLSDRISPMVQKEEEEEEALQMKSNGQALAAPDSVASQLSQSSGKGSRMSTSTNQEMSSAFGTDFSSVNIHTDPKAVQMNRSLGARAFTYGSDVYFNQGEYNPQSQGGKHLLAHELTHVVQQGGTKANAASPVQSQMQTKRIQRAWFDVGSVRVNVDYGDIYDVKNADLLSTIKSRFIAYTSAADSSAIDASLGALAVDKQRWVLFGLDVLAENTKAAHSRLNRTQAVQRLIAYAPSAAHTFLGGNVAPDFPAENEALRAAGWFEIALTAGLRDPSTKDETAVDAIVNPRPGPPGTPVPALKKADFHRRMEAGLKHLLKVIDPDNWKASKKTRDLPKLKVIADELMQEAKVFFDPYAHTSRTTVFGLSPAFKISNNIYDTMTRNYTNQSRKGYLRNRGGLVGRNTKIGGAFSDADIFKDVHYDGTRAADRAELETLITNLLNDPNIKAIVTRLLQHTGQQSGSGANTRIGLTTEYNGNRSTACEARWEAIDTLCHELLHSLAHPDFEATNVGVSGVLVEGFTEVLGVEFYNKHVFPKAKKDPAFKARMEAGLSNCPATPPHTASVGYGAYGEGADKILALKSISMADFKAVYFLGQVHLIGL